jgi:hypothetical protein
MDSGEFSRARLTSRLVVACLLSMGMPASLSAQAPVDVAQLIGKNRSEISAVFPGSGLIVRNWRGWDNAVLVPGRYGELVGLRLQPRTSIAEAEADRAVRELGVALEQGKYFAGREEHGYSDMAGAVRTVIYDLAADGSVTRIRIHATLADSQQ